MHDGHWSPVLGGSMPLKEDSLIELLMPILKSMDGDPALCFADDLTVSRERFRGVAQDAHRAATLTNRPLRRLRLSASAATASPFHERTRFRTLRYEP